MIILVIKNLFFNSDSEKKETGFIPTKKNITLLCIGAFVIGLYNAAFVIGDWIIALMILTSLFHFKYQNAVFLLVVSMLISQPFATWGYIQNNLVDFQFLIPMLFATLLAGTIAGYLVNKIHSQVLETILKYLSIALVAYLIWGIVV